MGIESPHSIEQEIEQMFFRELSLKGRAYENYNALKNVLIKKMRLNGISVEFHFNPGRVSSVMAEVDSETLKKRKCFLCPSGLSKEQLTYNYKVPSGNEYLIRVNPFPIFDLHFTLSSSVHTKQEIAGRYGDMLVLVDEMKDYVVFYNGPMCGASAPDHFHFQSFPKGNLPLEKLAEDDRCFELLYNGEDGTISEINSYIRGGYIIKSSRYSDMMHNFDYLYSLGKIHSSQEWEPRMNIVSWKHGDTYISVIFFRENSRPECFWGKGGNQRILISPASVEMSGIIMTSSKETFDSLTVEQLAKIMKEVSPENKYADVINEKIKNKR